MTNKKNKYVIPVAILIIILLSLAALFKNRISQSRYYRSLHDKVDFVINTKDVSIPEDALSLSVYDINNKEYLYFEGAGQGPTAASLSKLFVIDYAMTKIKLDDIIEVNKEVLDLVPDGSSLADIKSGQYTAKEILEAMLVPSGNDAANALAYNIGKKDLGDGYRAKDYVDFFVKNLQQWLITEGYTHTDLFDPSGFSTQDFTNLDDVNKVTLKLLDYDFVKECIGESNFTINTNQGDFTWKNTNELLDKNSLYYHENIKGVKTGTMADSYNIIALYEKNNRRYLITCLAAKSNKDRYQVVHAAIKSIIESN